MMMTDRSIIENLSLWFSCDTGRGVFDCVPLTSARDYETNITSTAASETAIEGSQFPVSSTIYHKQTESMRNTTTTSDITNNRRMKCTAFKDKYKVVPGRSFGILPTQLHEVFLSLRCDEFFCQPHPMAGKGVYDCVPLARR